MSGWVGDFAFHSLNYLLYKSTTSSRSLVNNMLFRLQAKVTSNPTAGNNSHGNIQLGIMYQGNRRPFSMEICKGNHVSGNGAIFHRNMQRGIMYQEIEIEIEICNMEKYMESQAILFRSVK